MHHESTRWIFWQAVCSDAEAVALKATPLQKALGGVSMVAGRALAGFLLFLSLPVLGVLWILFRLVEDGGPFLYRGVRIGRHGRLFEMFKIRTLSQGAEKKLHGVLHTSGSGLELRMGRFLRATRLDELPQLYNVLRGDMRFIGPRPERPSVYQRECCRLRGYERRFLVSPGLTGLSQFLTPHSAPKSVRMRIDNLLFRHENDPLWKLRMVLWTGGAIARNVVSEALHGASEAMVKLAAGRTGRSRRRRPRLARPAFRAFAAEDGWRRSGEWTIADISEQAIRVVPDRILQGGELVRLVIAARIGRRERSVRYQGIVQKVRPGRGDAPDEAVISIEPVSALHRYLSDSYVFRQTIAWPRHFCALSLLGRRVATAFCSRFIPLRQTTGPQVDAGESTDAQRAARVALRSDPMLMNAALTRSRIEALMRRRDGRWAAAPKAAQPAEHEEGAVR